MYDTGEESFWLSGSAWEFFPEDLRRFLYSPCKKKGIDCSQLLVGVPRASQGQGCIIDETVFRLS
jgi:hypothetical protein